jgi:beta-mannosidase
LSISKPELWYPSGAGKPYLYRVEAALLRADSSLIDYRSIRTGLRTIELVHRPDSLGDGFFFRVNGRPIFIKGANYIPPDNFIPRGRAKRAKLFDAMTGAHMNMVRVWGGGIYEDDEFYRLCDEKGIMVWQDFMFSGGMYPGDAAFLENVREEIRDNIIRLRSHPSLALWCGNNAIESSWYQQQWKRSYKIGAADSTRLWQDYRSLFDNLIPSQLAELDPERAYLPSSSPKRNDGFAAGNPANRASWHEDGLFSAFKEHTPRFMSEFGFQSYPEIRTLVPVTSGEGPDRESIDIRQTSKVDSRLVDTYMERLYPAYKDYESFLVLSQLLQAEGMKVAIENMRVDQPGCMGSMYWQLNDCWPGPSSSTVDYEGRWKALQFWMQHLYAPIMLLAEQNEKGDLRVRATSDETRTRYGTIALRLKSFDGDILWTQEQAVEIVPDTVKVYMDVPRSIFPDRFDRSTTVLEVILHARGKVLASNLLYFAQPKEMELPDPEFSYRVSLTEGGGFVVEVRADHHLKNVEFALEGVEADFSDNYFDLAPGGIREITILAPAIKTEKEMMQKLRVRQLLDWVK